jgi:hypothetical protein
MALSRTTGLVAGGFVLGMGAAMAACGFTGVGAALLPGDGGPSGSDASAIDGPSIVDEGGVVVVGGGGDSGNGGGSDAALDADGAAPDGSTFTCPSACTSCTGTTCNILCDATHACAKPIACPAGLPCHVTCNGDDACSQRTVSCVDASSCLVDCTQVHACQMMGVECGSGRCRVDCTGFAAACVSVNLSAKSAASLCLQCDAVGGSPGCMGTDATKPMAGRPCTLVCGGGGCNANGNGLNGCASAATCP